MATLYVCDVCGSRVKEAFGLRELDAHLADLSPVEMCAPCRKWLWSVIAQRQSQQEARNDG